MRDTPGLDRGEYPFAAHYLQLPAGRMHYVDEGRGRPIVMVHGTPTWSFLYRHLVKQLAADHRCLAPDNLGFGLSDKPAGWAYTPQAHADNLRTFIERLGLRDVTLVVHDFGGPIGLAYALARPENVARLVIFNTWLWSLRGNPQYSVAGALFGSPLGRLLYERFNFSGRVMMRLAVGSKEELPPAVHAQYLLPLRHPQARHATWVLARSLIGASDWYDDLWRKREVLAAKPARILWGRRDSAFRPPALARWREALPYAGVVEYEGVGHFVPEARGQEAAAQIADFCAEADALPSDQSAA